MFPRKDRPRNPNPSAVLEIIYRTPHPNSPWLRNRSDDVAAAMPAATARKPESADVRSGRSSDHKYVNDLTLRNRCVQYCRPTASRVGGVTDLSVEGSEPYLLPHQQKLCRH